ncbi:MAG TPA: hypothetical protein VN700_12590 [Vicinamibacterales bacterium]|nr:hypothetical protein [Vicinamibacterales bacterium]
MKSVLIAAALLVVSTTVPAAQSPKSVTGTWSGTLTIKHDGKIEEDFVLVVLKQNGADLTGTGGPDAENQYRITKGKVATADGATTVAFELIANGAHSVYSLKLVDGILKGEARVEGEDGQPRTAVVELKQKQ